MIWITGLPCSGKTSLAKALKKEIDQRGNKCIHLDGDELRSAMKIDYGDKKNFSEEKRKELSEIYSRLAKLIEDQGILTIVSTVSMNNHIRKLNREIHKNYFEIYIKESYEILKKEIIKKFIVVSLHMRLRRCGKMLNDHIVQIL